MTVYAVGSDVINGKEQSYINQAMQAIKQAGHESTNIGVHPNTVQSHGLSSSSSGQIGIQIVGGRGLGTPMDFHTGVTRGYYHYEHVYVIGSSEFTGNNLISSASMKNPVNVCEPGMNTSQCSQYLGMTPEQFNQKYTGCTVIFCDKFADGLTTMLGGNTDSNTEDTANSNGGSFKDAIQDLIKVWDGYVEVIIDTNIINIRRVHDPEEPEPVSHRRYVTNEGTGRVEIEQDEVWDYGVLREPEVWASEGVNIVHDSLSMTDYNPDTYNQLIVTYTTESGEAKSIMFSDEILIERFGEKSITKEAVWYSHETTTEDTDTEGETSTDTTTDTTDVSEATDEIISESTSESTESTTKNSSTAIPIHTYEEALEFGMAEWFKLQRDNGHKVECKVLGSSHWRVGRWCKIYLPVFSEYCDMYIDRVNHSYDGGEWLTSIECLPAPACIKEDDSNSGSDEEEETEEETEETEEETTTT